MITRTWGGKVPLVNAVGFHNHLLATGVEDYRQHPGCVEVRVLRRDSDGWAHFLLLSTWSSTDAIHEYAGESPNKAVLYPGDEAFGLVPDHTVTHYDVLPATLERHQADGRGKPDASVRIVSADELRAHVRFEDLIEPVATAFQQSSAGLAQSGLVVMFPLDRRDRDDVYVKTGTLQGHPIFIVKVSSWFAINVERGEAQGGFVCVFDSTTGHTTALLNEEHYLSDIRTAAAGALAGRALAPREVRTAAVLGAGVQAYWQALALHHERPFSILLTWARNSDKAIALRSRLTEALPALTCGSRPTSKASFAKLTS